MTAFLRTYADFDLQQTMDAAVVIPSVLRPSLAPALASIFAQNFRGRIHVLIGVDLPRGDLSVIEAAVKARPANVAVQVVWPGYSTARRNGGLGAAGDGGALRTVLTYLANSPYVAYLDDDNWWAPGHLRQMRIAMNEADWAFALRWFVHPETRRKVCLDDWESVGPGQGMFNEPFGGFVDPSCLMINKLACPMAAYHWLFPLRGDPMSADRNVFAYLSKNHRFRGTGQPSVYYTMNAKDGLHQMRVRLAGAAYAEAGAVSPPEFAPGPARVLEGVT